MEDGNKVGLGAAFVALLAGAAHFGDDLFRGAARLVSHERPVASVVGDVAPPVAEGAISSLQGDRGPRGTGSDDPDLRFGLILGRSLGEWSRSRPGLVAYEPDSKFRIRFVRNPDTRYSVIDLADDGSLAGTPLAACRNRLPSSTQRGVEQCVDSAMSEMTGCPPGHGPCSAPPSQPAPDEKAGRSSSSAAQEP